MSLFDHWQDLQSLPDDLRREAENFLRRLAPQAARHGKSPAEVVELVLRVLQSDIVTWIPMEGEGETITEIPGATVPPLAINSRASPLGPSTVVPDAEGAELLGTSLHHTARYHDLGILGAGGMAEVRRILDRELNRVVAMKIIHRRLLSHPGAVTRFIEEAQISAQLQHPGIIPVHELGKLGDGRLYFTMKEVCGRTLEDLIREVHQSVRSGHWAAAPSGWTFRRLIEVFRRACEAVAYAHSRGVVHRDLKPRNLMVEELGEVLILDWGVAKVLGRPDPLLEAEPLNTRRTTQSALSTRVGSVTGTPHYMPPEQARGRMDQVDKRSDVYALGAILYEILGGERPFASISATDVLTHVSERSPEPLSAFEPDRPIPKDLIDIQERAMSRDPAFRFSDATALAREIAAWLDGARRRDRALAYVARADEVESRAHRLHKQADQLRIEAQALMKGIQPWFSEEKKAPGWMRADEAIALEQEAGIKMLQAERMLRAALLHEPDLPEAHAALARRFQNEHRMAERVQDSDTQRRAEVFLRAHTEALPLYHPDLKEHLDYLAGMGDLTIDTLPSGARADLYRFELKYRRLVPVYEEDLDRTPVEQLDLPIGSYAIRIQVPGRLLTWVPVVVERQHHWSNTPPDGGPMVPVKLLSDSLGSSSVPISAGWFWFGGDHSVDNPFARRRLWVDGFVIRRHPITNLQYLEFLNALIERGQARRAEILAPQRGHTVAYVRASSGYFALPPADEVFGWGPNHPVTCISWWAAQAYADWYAQRTGRPWRLPSEVEWEKAARGVDARYYPWGDRFDPSWCCMRLSHDDLPYLSEIETYPVDESPYGVRGLAGNVREWCADVYRPDPVWEDGQRTRPVKRAEQSDNPNADRALRGGSWMSFSGHCRAAFRFLARPDFRGPATGFRLVHSIS